MLLDFFFILFFFMFTMNILSSFNSQSFLKLFSDYSFYHMLFHLLLFFLNFFHLYGRLLYQTEMNFNKCYFNLFLKHLLIICKPNSVECCYQKKYVIKRDSIFKLLFCFLLRTCEHCLLLQ